MLHRKKAYYDPANINGFIDIHRLKLMKTRILHLPQVSPILNTQKCLLISYRRLFPLSPAFPPSSFSFPVLQSASPTHTPSGEVVITVLKPPGMAMVGSAVPGARIRKSPL